jgi:Protein of unknown function (DUF2490)
MMMNKILFLFIIIFITINLNTLKAQENDAELWTSFSVEKEIVKNFAIEIEAAYRLENNMQVFSKAFIESSLSYRFNDFFKISTEYRFEKKNNFNDDYVGNRNRFKADIQSRYKFSKIHLYWTISYQNKFFDNYSYIENNQHIRNEFQLKYKLKSFKPFIKYEFFTPLDYVSVFQYSSDAHRFSIGSDYKINKRNSFKLFFIYHLNKNETYNSNRFISGLSYKITL